MTLLPTRRIETEFGAVRIADTGGKGMGGKGMGGKGMGGAPLVLVHGYPDNLQIWSRLIGELNPDRRVIAMDWPGLGHSASYTGGATPFHLGRHFLAVIDALEIERVVPVGFDMGAHGVVAAAARQPERIEQLVLTNFLADGEVRTSWDIAVMRRLGLNRLVLRFGARVVFERARRTFLADPSSLSADVSDDMWNGFRRTEARTHLRRMCIGYQAALPRVARLYPDINVDTLLVWGDADPHFPLDQAHALKAALPRARLQVLPGASHWMMWEHAPALARTIESFLH